MNRAINHTIYVSSEYKIEENTHSPPDKKKKKRTGKTLSLTTKRRLS